jgi:hypothetical protein
MKSLTAVEEATTLKRKRSKRRKYFARNDNGLIEFFFLETPQIYLAKCSIRIFILRW